MILQHIPPIYEITINTPGTENYDTYPVARVSLSGFGDKELRDHQIVKAVQEIVPGGEVSVARLMQAEELQSLERLARETNHDVAKPHQLAAGLVAQVTMIELATPVEYWS